MLKNTYNKEVTHRSYTFNVKVVLAESVEIGEGGKTFHSVIINDMGPTNYYVKRNCESADLETTISELIANAIIWADDRDSAGKDTEELLLESIGFV